MQWVRKVLVRESLVSNYKRPKYVFQEGDLSRLLLTLWTRDDPIFIHERSRIPIYLYPSRLLLDRCPDRSFLHQWPAVSGYHTYADPLKEERGPGIHLPDRSEMGE